MNVHAREFFKSTESIFTEIGSGGGQLTLYNWRLLRCPAGRCLPSKRWENFLGCRSTLESPANFFSTVRQAPATKSRMFRPSLVPTASGWKTFCSATAAFPRENPCHSTLNSRLSAAWDCSASRSRASAEAWGTPDPAHKLRRSRCRWRSAGSPGLDQLGSIAPQCTLSEGNWNWWGSDWKIVKCHLIQAVIMKVSKFHNFNLKITKIAILTSKYRNWG